MRALEQMQNWLGRLPREIESARTGIIRSSLGHFMPNASRVRIFHEAFAVPVAATVPEKSISETLNPQRLQLRLDLIAEEHKELLAAVEADDVVEAADALGDLLYVVYGMAVEMGLPIHEIFLEIHASNMSKLNSDGHPILREDGKILKGPNYVPPDIAGVLANARQQ